MIYLQIANLQFSTKYCTTLRQNSPKSSIFKDFCVMSKFELEHYSKSIFVRRYSLYLRACGSFKSANHKKDWVCISQIQQSAEFIHICRSSANLTNFLSPQICGNTICGTYLQNAHLGSRMPFGIVYNTHRPQVPTFLRSFHSLCSEVFKKTIHTIQCIQALQSLTKSTVTYTRAKCEF